MDGHESFCGNHWVGQRLKNWSWLLDCKKLIWT